MMQGEVEAILQANSQMEKEKWEDAISLIYQGLQLNPKNYELYFMLAQCKEMLGQCQQAKMAYENALLYSTEEDRSIIEECYLSFLESVTVPLSNVSIVLVTYNQLEYTKLCVESIRKHNLFQCYEIILVDNLSTDGTREWVQEQNDIKYILNDDNVGFPAACNQGASIATPGNDIFLLNNDTILMENSVFNLRMALYEDDKTGIVGACSNSVGNRQQIQESFETIEEYEKYAGKNNVYQPERHEKRTRLIGFAMIVKWEEWQNVGGFDERYGIGNFEDDDLCIKVLCDGLHLVLCNDSFIFHFGGKSFGTVDNAKRVQYQKLLKKNKETFEEKWNIQWGYFSKVCKELVDGIEEDCDKSMNVLEIGCGSGATLLEIGNRYPNASLYGMENNREIAKIAEKYLNIKYFTEETIENVFGLEYDYIILGDILECFSDPEMIVQKVKSWLCPDGHMLISVPNVMHISVIRPLLYGRFTYTDHGVLSEGNLKFFTKTELEEMMQRQNLQIEQMGGTFIALTSEEEEAIEKLAVMDSSISKDELKVYQYFVKVRSLEKTGVVGEEVQMKSSAVKPLGLNVKFEPSFYRGEYRCGFFVTSEAKRAWAAQLDVLAEIDRVCKKHDITYFADSGTLLGAVRHQGFIPWDDDLDISMLRVDYDKFLEVFNQESDSRIKVYRAYEDGFSECFARVINAPGIEQTTEDYSWSHGFEFYAGVDVFPLDYLSADSEEAALHLSVIEAIEDVRRIIYFSEKKDELDVEQEQIEQFLQAIESMLNISIARDDTVFDELGKLYDRVCKLYKEEECSKVGFLSYVSGHSNWAFRKEWYNGVEYLDFEGMKIPCPSGYDEVLKAAYGNYMEFVKGEASHDYPYWGKVKKEREELIKKKILEDTLKSLASFLEISVNQLKNAQVVQLKHEFQKIRYDYLDHSYFFRIPRVDQSFLANFENEYRIMSALQPLEITETIQYYQKENGNKITLCRSDSHYLDTKSWEQVSFCMNLLRYIHDMEISGVEKFDLLERIRFYENLLDGYSGFHDYSMRKQEVEEIMEQISGQELKVGLTNFHLDAKNIMLGACSDNQCDVRILDWEYAGIQDTHIDIAMFALYANYSREELDRLIDIYFDGICSPAVRRKIYGYMAACSLYLSNYYEYYDTLGDSFTEETLCYHRLVEEYYRLWKSME